MTIRFSANINLVTQEALLKQFPHLGEIVKIDVSNRYQLSNAVTIRRRGKPSHLWQKPNVKNREEFERRQQQFAALRQFNPTDVLRYTDPASVCTIASIASRNRCDIFHLIPAAPLLSITKPDLAPLQKDLERRLRRTPQLEGSLLGGVNADLESQKLYAGLNGLLKRLNIPTRRIWGKKSFDYNTGLSVYYSRRGNLWCVPSDRSFSTLPDSQQQRLMWLKDNYQRINLLPHDRLFIHDLNNPIINGPKSEK